MPSDAACKLKRAEPVLLAIGIMCLLAWGGLRIYSLEASSAAVRSFEVNQTGGAATQADSSTTVDVRLWSNERIAAYRKSLGELTIAPIAVLRIRKIGLAVPVFNGTDEVILNRGVGRVPGTAKIGELGNLAIAGHRDGFFRELGQLSPGDVIEVAGRGRVDRYTVTATRVVMPEDTSVLKKSASPTLTLITCFPFHFIGHAPQRYIVSAVHDALHDPLLAEKKEPRDFSGTTSQKQ